MDGMGVDRPDADYTRLAGHPYRTRTLPPPGLHASMRAGSSHRRSKQIPVPPTRNAYVYGARFLRARRDGGSRLS